MILNPGILALLLGGGIALALLLYATRLGWQILRYWDGRSCSEQQLLLERRGILVSSLVNYAFAFQLLSTLLFVYTLEDIHPLFIGAMCATGSLNANPIGWTVLGMKLLLFFFAALWIVANRLDLDCEETPLLRAKYLALLFLTPLVALEQWLQFRYFSGLKPEIITSCCGSLFSLGQERVASQLAGLPPAPSMLAFFLSSAVFLLLLMLCLCSRQAVFRYLLSGSALVLLLVSLVAVIAFISCYIYQMPTHHCPFDMLQKNYAYIGYPLYLGLFGASLFGLLPGLCQPLKRIPSLCSAIEKRERRWLLSAFFAIVIFLLIAVWPILFRPFMLLGY